MGSWRNWVRYQKAVHRESLNIMSMHLRLTPVFILGSLGFLFFGSLGLWYFVGEKEVYENLAYTFMGSFGLGICAYIWARSVAPIRLLQAKEKKLKGEIQFLERKLADVCKENAQLQNSVQPIIEIQFSGEDDSYRFVGRTTGYGLREGQWQAYRIKIFNASQRESIQRAQVQLTFIDPLPRELSGQIPLNFKFTNYPAEQYYLDIAPRQDVLVSIASYFESFLVRKILIEQAGNSQPEIDDCEDKNPKVYEMQIVATGLNCEAQSKRFLLGVKSKNLFLQEVI